MKASAATINKMYQNMGKLFYAIASADKVIRDVEINALKDHVKNKWLELDDVRDEFGSDAAFQIEIVFDWLKEETQDVDRCFEEFKEFRKDHKSLFNPRVNKLILDTSESIASVFSGVNNAELAILIELNKILSQDSHNS